MPAAARGAPSLYLNCWTGSENDWIFRRGFTGPAGAREIRRFISQTFPEPRNSLVGPLPAWSAQGWRSSLRGLNRASAVDDSSHPACLQRSQVVAQAPTTAKRNFAP